MTTVRETVLVVEDDPQVRELLVSILEAPGRVVSAAGTCAEARAAFRREAPAVVLLDIGLPDGSGLELLEEALAEDPTRVAVMLTGRLEQDSVIGAMRRGAMDYLTKPFSAAGVKAMVDKAAALARRNRAAPTGGGVARSAGDAEHLERFLVGRSAPMIELYKLIGRIAPADLPVLIRGESGTGKELVARALHRWGARPGGPFVAVDCGSLPAGLFEAELFGFERGAFTGAVAAKPGRFELADGGTLFLDEVGNIPLELQAKLLRALQEKTSQRVGGSAPVRWDARVVAATNADLREEVARGRFREDLLYRLAGVELVVPPLRERRDDLPLLLDHFLDRWRERRGRLTVSAEALRLLAAWPWPGNVRELEYVANRAAALAAGSEIGPEDLPEDIRLGRVPGPPLPPELSAGSRETLVTLETMKRRYARHALAVCGGRKAEAARALGIDRKTLASLLRSDSPSEA
jgi:DNA-binding NtrC family response regulator